MTDLLEWSQRLESHAAPVFSRIARRAADEPENLLKSFADEMGHRRAVDRPLLAHVFSLDPGPPPDISRMMPDAALWWSLSAGDWQPSLLPDGGDPLLVHRPDTSLEVRTEAELAAMHALWSIGRLFKRPDLQQRALAAARVHVEHTQPDNATNHAWGVHVFLLAARSGTPDGELFAQTLVHNCSIDTGQPDVFSSCLLTHAARELRLACSTAED